MRAIAEAAGVAVGNAYYYFRAKEYLVQAFYERTHDEHLEASREVLVVRLITLAKLPILRPLTNTVLAMMEDLRKDPEELS